MAQNIQQTTCQFKLYTKAQSNFISSQSYIDLFVFTLMHQTQQTHNRTDFTNIFIFILVFYLLIKNCSVLYSLYYTKNILFVYIYKNRYVRYCSWIEIRSSILQCNMKYTKSILFTVLCISNLNFCSVRNAQNLQ